jgi:hypothetical protein
VAGFNRPLTGESLWNHCKWAADGDRDQFEKALEIIGHGSFPGPDQRGNLTPGQRRQLRDAIIACTHLRDGHDVLLTNDQNGFVDDGRRERFRDELGIRIMTLDEFRREYL